MSLSLHEVASANGKVILLGEHAVVYGQPALAAGLPDALSLRARPRPDTLAPITLRIPAWDVDIELSPDSDHPVARAVLEVLAWSDGPVTGWALEGDTALPSRAGLGSSAALTVAVARLVLGPDAELDQVVEASMAGERVFHGNPSGIDSEVAARGGLIRYVRGQSLEQCPLRHPLRLCIVPSGVPRSTAVQVAKVRRRHDELGPASRPVIAALGTAVDMALAALEQADFPRLGDIFDFAHGCLAALDVSSLPLDRLCALAREHGALGAKLTGAGGGGCIVALPPSDPSAAAAMVDALRREGYSPYLVEVNP